MMYPWLLSPLLLFSSIALAEDELRWYTVEVIAFAHTSTAGVQEERWPEDTGIPDSINTVSLIPVVESDDIDEEVLPGQPIEFQELPLEILSDSLDTLQQSSRYQVLQAKAWRFQGLPLESALAVRIKAGQRYLVDGEVAPELPAIPEPGMVTLARETHRPTTNTYATEYDALYEDDVLYELDGRVRISLTRFLDVDADLIYRTHVMLPDTLGSLVSQFHSFRLTEFRRMKSNTIHYLDHPMFGLIIAINRYQLPELFEIISTQEALPATPPASARSLAPITAQ